MKTKTHEEPNFATKSSVGRVKTKKDRRVNTEGLHIVDDFYKPNMKYGIQSIVEDSLEEYETDFLDEFGYDDYIPNEDEDDYIINYE